MTSQNNKAIRNDDRYELKKQAAARALALVRDGMRLGLGTGSTAAIFIDMLGEKVRQGLQITGVATSEATHRQAEACGIPLFALRHNDKLDLTIDGADEIDSDLTLIKGGGGALLREKIIAAAGHAMLVIADESKLVDRLGAFPLPVEVSPFAHEVTADAIAAALAAQGLSGDVILRKRADKGDKDNKKQVGETGEDAEKRSDKDTTAAFEDAAFISDGGHYIYDCMLSAPHAITAPLSLADALSAIPGVMEHGLFIGLAKGAFIAGPDGVRELGITEGY